MSRKAIGKKTVSCTPITGKPADKPALFRRFRQLFFVFGTPVPFPFCESSARLTPGGPILRKCVKRGAAFFWGAGVMNKDHPPGLVQIAQVPRSVVGVARVAISGVNTPIIPLNSFELAVQAEQVSNV